VKFEWDENKNRMNIRKHKIDFADIPNMFNYPTVIDIDERDEYGETRFIAIGILRNTVALVIYTEPDEETIRILSARKAIKYEREKYKQAIAD